MPKDSLVLVDTSAWIDYFLQKNSHLEQILDARLETGEIATATVILAELTQGAKSEKEIKKLKEYFQPLHWIQSADIHWHMAGALSFQMRQKGKKVNLTDCYIAALARQSGASILSLDKHFLWLAQSGACSLLEIS